MTESLLIIYGPSLPTFRGNCLIIMLGTGSSFFLFFTAFVKQNQKQSDQTNCSNVCSRSTGFTRLTNDIYLQKSCLKLRNEISENDTTISSHQESLKRRNRLDPCTGFTRVSRRTLYQILVAESTGGELAVSMVSNLSDTRWARSGPEIIARSEI